MTWFKKKAPRATIQISREGILWEVWWRRDVLFASTSHQACIDLAALINTGRNTAARMKPRPTLPNPSVPEGGLN